MKCDRKRISYYLDGELSVAERVELDMHLRSCATCQATLREYRQIRMGIRSLPARGMPGTVRDRVLAQVRDSAPRARPARAQSWFRAVLPAVASLVVMIAAIFLLRGPARGPALESSFPQPGAQGVSTALRIELDFTEAVDGESARVSLQPSVEILTEWRDGRLIIVPLRELAPNTLYTVRVEGARSADGAEARGPLEVQFRTGSAAPSVRPRANDATLAGPARPAPAGEGNFRVAAVPTPVPSPSPSATAEETPTPAPVVP